ncbi:golgin subfamily A member 6-like protein 22 [Notolabrus celidotus]|uniref:golgin subfamily A member 6-like protein 22 n=1 Tax=Notolabrus celidotus TaxID=1203425 RepID=UPI00149008BB|nr:golgin subfamily A member 6-like protein 22 [Notolabrus celidotus]
MDKDFHDERKALQNLNTEQLEEILNLGTQLLVYQPRDNQCEEKWAERVRQLEEEEVETSRRALEKERLCGEGRIRSLQEGMQSQAKVDGERERQLEEEVETLKRRLTEESLQSQEEDKSAKLSSSVDPSEIRKREEQWTERVKQLEEEVETSRIALERLRLCGEGRVRSLKKAMQNMVEENALVGRHEETIKSLKNGMQNMIEVNSGLVGRYEEQIKSNQDKAATELRQSEKKWTERVKQLEEEVETLNKRLTEESLKVQEEDKAAASWVDPSELRQRKVRLQERVRQLEGELERAKRMMERERLCEGGRIRSLQGVIHNLLDENSRLVDLYEDKIRDHQHKMATELRQCEDRWTERERETAGGSAA